MAGAGKIAALSISVERGTDKTNVEEVSVVAGRGIEGDAHAGDWDRQVSLLPLESVNRMRAKGLDVNPGAFAENVTTAGVSLAGLKIGDRILLGGKVELDVTQIGKECHDRCAIFEQAGECIMPVEGVFTKVLRGGTVRIGDPVEIRYRTKNREK
jgi:MOSC domain-containing protein YiiM